MPSIRTVPAATWLLLALDAGAATYCVTNSSVLQAVLSSATADVANGDEYVEIRIAAGFYIAPEGSGFHFQSTSPFFTC